MIRAVLFDMDGTLVDSERYYCDGTYRWMQRVGYTGKKEAVYAIIGTTMEETYAIIHRLLDGKYTLAEIEELNHDYFYLEDPIDYRKYLFPEVSEVLKLLKEKGYGLALCSASSMKDIEKFICTCGFSKMFDVVLSADDTKPKPDPEIYERAMAALKVGRNECVVVEDSPYGIESGKRLGAFTIARRNEHLLKSKQEGADMIINDLNDLVRYLGV